MFFSARIRLAPVSLGLKIGSRRKVFAVSPAGKVLEAIKNYENNLVILTM
jgi:hypothetical protein